jgi:transcriptional regulator with AAA-type ATPase domain
LLESETFGHERGAFTGASGPRHGLFSTADGGTIFLDEIGEMSMQLQAKLLRVLEDGIVRPVGSDRASKIDPRVIAASNSDLVAGVKKGSFREDLFYRLQVVPIAIARCARAVPIFRCWSSIFSHVCKAASLAATGRLRRRRWSVYGRTTGRVTCANWRT